jgi:hypothetical protein
MLQCKVDCRKCKHFLFLLQCSTQCEFRGWDKIRYNAMWSFESQSTFRRNISPPFSGSNKPRNIPARKQEISDYAGSRKEMELVPLITIAVKSLNSPKLDVINNSHLRQYSWLTYLFGMSKVGYF